MRKLLLILAAAIGGTFALAAPAHAQPASPVDAPYHPSPVVAASGSPPVVLTSVRTPTLPRYRVVSGDSLWSIGIRLNRPWTALAAYNRSLVPNPNLIYVGQVLTIPPVGYSGSVALPVPAPRYSSPVTHSVTHHYSAPVVTYTPRPAPVVSSYAAPGSFKACVEMRESTDGRGSSNLYGILNSTWASLGRSGSAYSASPAEQSAAFDQLYAKDGAQPWRPYDGC
jgi:LysM repeat protein